MDGQRHASTALSPRNRQTHCPLYRRLCGPQGRCERVPKICTPNGNRSPDLPACSKSLYRRSYVGRPETILYPDELFLFLVILHLVEGNFMFFGKLFVDLLLLIFAPRVTDSTLLPNCSGHTH